MQRDRTFGRLVHMLVPWEIRTKVMGEGRIAGYAERTGRDVEHMVGDLIRGAAVAWVDLSDEKYS